MISRICIYGVGSYYLPGPSRALSMKQEKNDVSLPAREQEPVHPYSQGVGLPGL